MYRNRSSAWLRSATSVSGRFFSPLIQPSQESTETSDLALHNFSPEPCEPIADPLKYLTSVIYGIRIFISLFTVTEMRPVYISPWIQNTQQEFVRHTASCRDQKVNFLVRSHGVVRSVLPDSSMMIQVSNVLFLRRYFQIR